MRTRPEIILRQHCVHPAAAPHDVALQEATMRPYFAEIMDELARDLSFEYSTASADIDEQACRLLELQVEPDH